MAERTKRYLIKLNYKSLDIKYKNALAKQVEDDKFQRNIIKQNQNFMIIKVALFFLIDKLDTICNKLNLDKEELISNELEINTSGKYSFKCNRCKFLDDDNNCLAEECLPKSCRDYPYTNRSERLFSLYGIIGNASICPVVYEILEELKGR